MSFWSWKRKPKPFSVQVLVSFDGYPSTITLSGASEKHVLALKAFIDYQANPKPEVKGFGEVFKPCN